MKNGFFDEMDRKLSQFGQSVSNKSREVSEGMRLSSAIKAEEEKQNNLYREVGKYYFENCAANAEGQLKVLCDQIVASMELTSQYKQQQNVLKRNGQLSELRSTDSCQLWIFAMHVDQRLKSRFHQHRSREQERFVRSVRRR